jgi:molybdopterin synthase catalytic subunit
MLKVELRERSFNPHVEVQNFQVRLDKAVGDFGATAIFIGTMRDFNDGAQVHAITLEHYSGMTERILEQSLHAVASDCGIRAGLVLHRVGLLHPGDPIVLVAVWTVHRASAFDACRRLVEELKSEAPFWKKEARSDGEHWVEHNTPG